MTSSRKSRWWLLLFVFIAVAALLAQMIGLFSVLTEPDETEAYEKAPAIALTQPAPNEAKTVDPPEPIQLAIDQSPATAMYVVDTSRKLDINSKVKPLVCNNEINPPLDGYVYGCSDRAQPGTDTKSFTVLAGHSSHQMDTALNDFYTQGDGLIGNDILVRTKASGDKLLAYKVHDVYTPLKTDLVNMTEVWGKADESTAGRLIVVTCLQRDDMKPSTRNFVVVAQYEDVVDEKASSK